MGLDEAVEWLRDHVSDLRSTARVLRESPWGAKLAATAAEIDKAADEGALAIAALEAARKDTERYRHIRKKESSGGSADLCIFRVRWAKSGVKTPEPDYDLLVECEADAAIDQARGKGGCREGVKS
jgi:hypothetical protein